MESSSNNTIPPPAPFPAEARSVDLSALEFVVGLIAVIAVPALIYTIFFTIKCPPRRHQRTRDNHNHNHSHQDDVPLPLPLPPSAAVKYSREMHSGECPVCLSAFADGDDVKPLSECGHAFHAACVETWLTSHPSCPVCRAIVASAVKPPPPPLPPPSRSRNTRRDDDYRHGLPDASNLV